MSSFIDSFVYNIIPLIFAVVLHEISHGVAAYALGDDTAQRAGRFKLHTHFDLYGSFLIPLGLYLLNSPFLIGYAKPVPVNPRNFKSPLRDMALVAIAGPLCNVILAIITALCMRNFSQYYNYTLMQICFNFVAINLVLFFFNLIPIPPLDGSRLLAAVMPIRLVAKFYSLEAFGFFIILGIEIISRQISNAFGVQVGIFDTLIRTPLISTLNFLLS